MGITHWIVIYVLTLKIAQSNKERIYYGPVNEAKRRKPPMSVLNGWGRVFS